MRQATDYRGRKLGSISAVEGLTALVRWPDSSGRMGPPQEVALDGQNGSTKGLLQAEDKNDYSKTGLTIKLTMEAFFLSVFSLLIDRLFF